MKKNIIILLLAVSCIVLAVLSIPRRTAPQIPSILPPETVIPEAKVEQDTDAHELAELKHELADRTLEIQALRDQLAAVQAPRDQSPVASPEVEALASETGEALNAGIPSLVKKLLADGVLSQQGNKMPAPTTEEKYAAFIAGLGLSDLENEQFMELLKNRQQRSRATKKQAQEDIRAFLGDDAYAEYEEYERTMPTRLFVDDLAVRLSQLGHPLSENQVEALSGLNPDIAGKVPLSYEPMRITVKNAYGDNAEEGINRAVDQSVEIFDQTVAYSEGILTAEQMAGMDQYLGERFQEKEAAASMASQILPGINIRDMGVGGADVSSKVTTSITILPAIRSSDDDVFSGE